MNKKKTLTPAKGVGKKKTHTHTHILNYKTNTHANCLASLDKWDPPN